MRVTEKLQETDREYELSLQAIAEKEKNLGQKSESLNLLQKQVSFFCFNICSANFFYRYFIFCAWQT